MKLQPETVFHLHDLYHRKEEGKYIVGHPETAEFIVVTPPEFRALNLIHSGLSLKHVQELLHDEKEDVDVISLINELKERGFIYKIDNQVITPLHEPLHELRINVRWLGGPAAKFLFILITLWGLWTLIWRGTIPSYTIFFQEYLSMTLISVIVVAWLLIALRQLVKHAAAQASNIPCRFGLTTMYHVFIPKAYTIKVSEHQEHHVLGMSLLSLTAAASVLLLLATYTNNWIWSIAFAIAFIEILSECLLFVDTDLAKFITLTTNIHKLNRQTAKSLKEDAKLLFHGKGKQTHITVARYAFFYLASMLLAFILLTAYIIPAVFGFLVIAFNHFTPNDPLFMDSFLALLFFSIDFLLYGFAVLKHHHLSHHKLFINTGLSGIVVGTFILSTVGTQWFLTASDTLTTILLTCGLGVLLAIIFEAAVRFAHPFTEHHELFENGVLPVLAACVPLSILFTVSAESAYACALALGMGMLIGVTLSHLSKDTAPI